MESGIIYEWKMQGDRGIGRSLILAVRQGRIEKVRQLISSFSLSYSRDWSDGYVLLCDALKNKHTKIAKLLLTKGSKVNSINENPSMTPLHFAVRNGDVDNVEMLLDKEANIDAESEDGLTPLHIAIQCNQLIIIGSLIRRGASINAVGKYGITALHIATMKANTKIVAWLLSSHRANVNSVCTYDGNERCTPLYIAVKNRHEEVVKQLLEYRADVDAEDKDGKTILYLAVQTKQVSIVKHLLNYHYIVPMISKRWGALMDTTHGYGELDSMITKCLIEYCSDIDLKCSKKAKFRHKAVPKTYLKVAEDLLRDGPILNFRVGVCRKLFRHQCSINSKNDHGKTILHTVSEEGKPNGVKVLLKFGANVDSRDDDGNTALHIASAKHNLEIVEVLLKHGAGIDSKDRHGKTALHIACKKDNIQIVNVLLKYGASTDSKDGRGKTALNYASLRKTWVYRASIIDIAKTIVTALLDHGSDITMVSEKYYHESFAEILKRHAVKVKTANLYVTDKSLLISSDDEELSDFRNECKQEVANMKSEKVDNTTISFYDILTKGIRQLAGYARNESIAQVFESDNYKLNFPIYATLINSNFRKGERRRDLREQCHEMFCRFTNFRGILYDCTEEIFNYLSNDDLRTIMDACKPISACSSNTDNK